MVNSRNKGASFERWLVKVFRGIMPNYEVRRGLQSRGADVADVDLPYFWVEAKVGKCPNPRAALKQACGDAPPNKIPIAVIKDDRTKPFVVMSLDDFLALAENWIHSPKSFRP